MNDAAQTLESAADPADAKPARRLAPRTAVRPARDFIHHKILPGAVVRLTSSRMEQLRAGRLAHVMLPAGSVLSGFDLVLRCLLRPVAALPRKYRVREG